MSRHYQHVPTRPVHYLSKPLWGLSYFDPKTENLKTKAWWMKIVKKEIFLIPLGSKVETLCRKVKPTTHIEYEMFF